MLVLARARGFNARTRSVLGILMLDPSLVVIFRAIFDWSKKNRPLDPAFKVSLSVKSKFMKKKKKQKFEKVWKECFLSFSVKKAKV